MKAKIGGRADQKDEVIQDELIKQLEEVGAIVELPKGELTMPKWMECTWRRVPCGKDDCKICGRIKQDRLRYASVFCFA